MARQGRVEPELLGINDLSLAPYLFGEPSYGTGYALVFLFLILGMCAVAIPRFRKIDPLERKKKKKKRRK